MGVNQLKKFLRERGLVDTIPISQFANSKISVDISSYIYKNKSVLGEEWKNLFIPFIISLRKYNIHGNFIFEGKAPLEKLKEQNKRKDFKKQLEDSLFTLEVYFERYLRIGESDPILEEAMIKIKKKDNTEGRVHKFLNKGLNSTSISSSAIDNKLMNEYIDKRRKQIININEDDITHLKELLTIFGIPWIQALGEGEALASYLCHTKECQAVLTEDTDVLVYGAKIYLSNFNSSQGTCEVIYLEKVLENLQMSMNEFIDFCIMCGVDHNSNIPQIGIKGSFNIIGRHKSIEAWETENSRDTDILNYKRCREIFTTFGNLDITVEYKSKYWSSNIDFEKVKKFLDSRNIKYGELEKYWNLTEIIFEKL